MKKIGITRIRELKETLLFSIQRNWWYTAFFLLFLIASYIIAKNYKVLLFDNLIDPIAGIMTLVVAVGIALMNYYNLWRDSLPKTLTLHFLLKGKYVLSCYYADLVSEGDIRNWAQQLGSQMTGGSRLEFEPFFDLDPPHIVKLASNGEYALHYKLEYYLKSDINTYNGKKAFDAENWKRWYICQGKDDTRDVKVELLPLPSRTIETEPNYKTDVFRDKQNKV